jgi:hypothetical protein
MQPAFSQVWDAADRARKTAKKILENRERSMADLGEDYYNSYFQGIRTLALSRALRSAINTCRINQRPFEDFHRRVSYFQANRFFRTGKGQSNTPDLQPVDFTNAERETGTGPELKQQMVRKGQWLDGFGIIHASLPGPRFNRGGKPPKAKPWDSRTRTDGQQPEGTYSGMEGSEKARASKKRKLGSISLPANGEEVQTGITTRSRTAQANSAEELHYPPTRSPVATHAKLATHIITGQTPLELALIKYMNALIDSIRDPAKSTPLPKLEEHKAVKRSNQEGIRAALKNIQLNVQWTDAELTTKGKPKLSTQQSKGLFNLTDSLLSFQRLGAPPPWVQEMRAILDRVRIHFGAEHPALYIGHGVRFRPRELTDEAFLVGGPQGHQGWLDSNQIMAGLGWLLRDTQRAQFVDPGRVMDGLNPALSFGLPPLRYNPATTPILFVPWNEGNHWTLVIVDFTRRQIHHLNSLRTTGGDPRASVQQWLRQIGHNTADFALTNYMAPVQQTNLADCGFWVVANAHAYLMNQRVAGDRDTGSLRVWLASVIAGALLGSEATSADRHLTDEPDSQAPAPKKKG